MGTCGAMRNQTSLNFFARSLMISRTFVLNVFCAVDKVSLFIINCMRFVFVLISVTSMKDIFDTIFLNFEISLRKETSASLHLCFLCVEN